MMSLAHGRSMELGARNAVQEEGKKKEKKGEKKKKRRSEKTEYKTTEKTSKQMNQNTLGFKNEQPQWGSTAI